MATVKLIEHQLEKIKGIAEEKAQEIDIKDYKKYNAIYEAAISYIKTQKVLLYGGQAIHELMPKKYKIYSPNTLPDIDVFALDGKKVAEDVVKFLKRKGYAPVSFTEALHEGTYKVHCQGLPGILDISTVPKPVFKRLFKHSVVGEKGLRVVNPQFLRLSLHMMLSQANDAFRWEKTYKRLVHFYKVFPPAPCKLKTTHHSIIPPDIVSRVYEIFEDTEYVLFGHRELEMMLGSSVPMDSKVPKVNVLVKDAVSDIANDIADLLDDNHITISRMYDEDMFVPDHVYIYYKKEPLLAVYHADSCITYNHYQKINVASLHTILRMYLGIMMSPNKESFASFTKIIECYANALTLIEQDGKVGPRRRAILREFMTQCYGSVQGLVTLRREQKLRQQRR